MEPTPSAQPPVPPKWLSAEARTVWRRLAPDLHQQGVLTHWDADVFAVFCDVVDQWTRAREVLGHGLLLKGRRDGLITNPAWRVYRDCTALLRSMAHEFGLTPSARAGLSVAHVNGLDAMLGPDADTEHE